MVRALLAGLRHRAAHSVSSRTSWVPLL